MWPNNGDEWAIIGLACDNAIHLESSDAGHADEWVDEGLIGGVPTLLAVNLSVPAVNLSTPRTSTRI